MSEYIKSDVGEYFTNRTMNFEKSPPDNIWNNIEKSIPVYNPTGTTSTLVKLVIGTISLSVIIFAVLWIKHLNFSEQENNYGLEANQKSSTLIQEKDALLLIQQNQQGDIVDMNIVSNEKSISNKTINQEAKNVGQQTKNEKTYSINATGLKGVTEISFVDEHKNVVLSSKNPMPNNYGFYVIDISKLSAGTFSVMITTNEGTRLHKMETFK